MQTIHTIGLMSGSSLDGLDIAFVQFNWNQDKQNPSFQFKILQTDYTPYQNDLVVSLKQAPKASAYELAQLHHTLGKYFGNATKLFINKYSINNINIICSHGQTIFHQPNKSFTTQIGCGATIAAITNCKTICDLRTTDMAFGGQGAPIVPITEKYLFSNYNLFLNIGGIANISIHQNNNCIAFDVVGANTVLNYLANQVNQNYDKDGAIAKRGIINHDLLQQFNNIEFLQNKAPKSLGTEHVFEYWINCINQYNITIEDKMATMVEHIAMQVNNVIVQNNINHNQKLLITGGGAKNNFLVERIRANTAITVEIPSNEIIDFKEALAIAFFGTLRYLEIPNVMASVTGASKNSIGGAIYMP
ncbi:MAG: anhydro-N-acetylmuramic acid kinase [Chitinophagales bacterium]|nr:anhydro-N-acetylmuramic acid kinase [Chitinophagales bacterium]